MTVRKSVPVTVELAGGVKTVEDIEGRLEILPEAWELASVGIPEVQVVIKVPRKVPDADVDKHVQHLMAALDSAHDEAVDGEAGHVGETARTYGRGSRQ